MGDGGALKTFLSRYLPRLHRWATGRLPASARGLLETDDLVQEVLIRTVQRLDQFEPRTPREFHSYLRTSLTNRIRDELRRVQTRPQGAVLTGAESSREPSPLETAIGRDACERYEAGLARLSPEDREAIVAKLELDCSYAELAEFLGKPSADAARVAVSRALVRLARELGHDAP